MASMVVNFTAIDRSEASTMRCAPGISDAGEMLVRITRCTSLARLACCANGMYSAGPGCSAGESCRTSATTPTILAQ